MAHQIDKAWLDYCVREVVTDPAKKPGEFFAAGWDAAVAAIMKVAHGTQTSATRDEVVEALEAFE